MHHLKSRGVFPRNARQKHPERPSAQTALYQSAAPTGNSAPGTITRISSARESAAGKLTTFAAAPPFPIGNDRTGARRRTGRRAGPGNRVTFPPEIESPASAEIPRDRLLSELSRARNSAARRFTPPRLGVISSEAGVSADDVLVTNAIVASLRLAHASRDGSLSVETDEGLHSRGNW